MAIRPSIGFLINDVAETCRRRIGKATQSEPERPRRVLDSACSAIPPEGDSGKGLFALDFHGRILPGATGQARKLLEVEDLPKAGLRGVLRMTGEQEFDFLNWLRLVAARNESLRWEKLLKLVPVRELSVLSHGDNLRRLRLDYLRVCDGGGNPKGVLVSVFEMAAMSPKLADSAG